MYRRRARRSIRVVSAIAIAVAAGAAWADADIIFVDSFGSFCGNNVIEVPETCDGNCPVCTEIYQGYTSTGSPDTCNVVCHVPIQTCQTGDNACPFVAGSGGAQCTAQSDAECLGSAWKSQFLRSIDTTSQACVTTIVYGIQAGGSYDLTTCAPGSALAGSGDTEITTVTDNLAGTYAVGNDDCTDATALPLLAGWTCNNNLGQPKMSCASPSPAGFRVPSGVLRLDVTVCRYGTDGGVAPLYIWYNATTAPNPG
jgi:hypothetical protein